MKTDLSLPELLTMIEIVGEYVDRNFPGVAPPRVLRDLQTKLNLLVSQHQREITRVIRKSRAARSEDRDAGPDSEAKAKAGKASGLK